MYLTVHRILLGCEAVLAIYILIIAAVPLVAEMIRAWIETGVRNEGPVDVIPGLFRLVYSENRGVAFGLFQDGTVFFAITTSIVIVIFFILLFKNYKKSMLFAVAASLIIGGGLANLIERVFLGYVVDYLSLSFFPPICNFADYCITAGTVCLIVYLLFFSDFLKDKKKKTDENA